MRRAGLVPVILEMRNKARHEDEVEWAITSDLVGDVDVAALRVVRFLTLHGLVKHLGCANSTAPA